MAWRHFENSFRPSILHLYFIFDDEVGQVDMSGQTKDP